MKAAIYLILFVALSSASTGVDLQYQSDLNRVYQTYKNADNYAYTMVVNVLSKNGAKNIETINAVQKKKGDNYYCELGSIVYLINKNYVITVNKKEKTIFIDKRNSAKNIPSQNIVDTKLDSIMRNNSAKVELVQNNDSVVVYRVSDEKQIISKVDLYINKKSWSFSKFIYLYNAKYYDDQRVEIYYKNFMVDPAFSNNEFSETRFVVKQKNDFIPTAKYNGYKIFKNFL